MATTVHARQGDTLDGLIWREAGLGSSAIALVFEANPGIAELGPILPHGHPVTIPSIAPAPDKLQLVQLWD
ncbi:tail protein X [Sphingomonas cavernae]|uniref:Phage tail protein n=1 Tax=Sphingomonas cavernae TaxID=2320861 RepID=A0A418WP14_9SPHN|nr:tail protein X [Sphingomonas cavernae]RJF92978.1 phage tail protein [Sphingomonas cavernae]